MASRIVKNYADLVEAQIERAQSSLTDSEFEQYLQRIEKRIEECRMRFRPVENAEDHVLDLQHH